jgi:hypothetical protein
LEQGKGANGPPSTSSEVIDEEFIEGKLEDPTHLARSMHDLFEPKQGEFRPRTI